MFTERLNNHKIFRIFMNTDCTYNKECSMYILVYIWYVWNIYREEEILYRILMKRPLGSNLSDISETDVCTAISR